MTAKLADIQMISDAPALDALCERVRANGWFAFDTEFIGEDQFKPKVCLMQAAGEGFCAVIDPLGGLDVAPMWHLFADEKVLAIVHAGSEELRQCRREISRPPANVFDLQIAAGFVGLGYPLSLSRLAKLAIGHKLHKGHTLTDWRRRPLLSEQIRYAVEDVIHLRPLYEEILQRLRALKREPWALEECAAACRAAGQDDDSSQKLRRLKGSGGLSGRQLAIAHAILDLRETLAAELNRPVRAVIKDHLVVEIARGGWSDPGRIRQLRGLSINRACVDRLARAVEAAKRLPPEAWPVLDSVEDSPQEDALTELLGAVLKTFCSRNKIAYSLLARKQDLRALVRGKTRPGHHGWENALSTGWRREAAGGLSDDLLAGRVAVRIVEAGPESHLRVE